MNRKLNQILWGGDKPGRATVLGIQHVFAMFGSTVLVPALTGLDPAVTLLCMGIGTLLFRLITCCIVPAFQNCSAVSFAITMIAPISSVTFAEHVGDITASGAVIAAVLGVILAKVLPQEKSASSTSEKTAKGEKNSSKKAQK